MNIRQYLISEKHYCVFMTGRAGSGKSTLADKIAQEIPSLTIYSLDDYFIGDSDYRKRRTCEVLSGVNSFWSHCTMTDWWDWQRLISDIQSAKYNCQNRLMVEGAILPSPTYMINFDAIFFIYHDNHLRERDLYSRDRYKRSRKDHEHRLTITNYAETLSYYDFFTAELLRSKNRFVALCDRQGNRITDPVIISSFLSFDLSQKSKQLLKTFFPAHGINN